MVRQEERPWQGKLTVLLDLRSAAHVEGPVSAPADTDERRRSSLEWAISAAATVAAHGVVVGREVGLVDDLAKPAVLPVLSTGQLADHLAVARSSSRHTLESFEGMLTSVARESTMVAVLGELDTHSLRLLAGVHPRGTRQHRLRAVARHRDVGRGGRHAARQAVCRVAGRERREGAAGSRLADARGRPRRPGRRLGADPAPATGCRGTGGNAMTATLSRPPTEPDRPAPSASARRAVDGERRPATRRAPHAARCPGLRARRVSAL